MQEFGENFEEKGRFMSKVILDHKLFGRQVFICENLQVINDEEKVGVIIHRQPKFVYKKDIVQETTNSISDGMLTITIY